MINIRKATDADWPAIWPIVQEVAKAGETYSLLPDLAEDEGRSMWMEPAPGQTVVAVTRTEWYSEAPRWAPNRPGPGSHVGTASFMVSSAARGRGVGRLLGEYVVQWLRDAGYHSIQFNAVVETNIAAVRLWKSLGFSVIGTVPEAFRHPTDGLVGLHVMYLRL